MSHQTDASLTLKHPIQPLYIDQSGLARFKENAIVVHLLDNGGIDMNALACLDFTQSDREQFAELIGYSLRGFSELSYVTDETLNAAVAMIEKDEKIFHMEQEIWRLNSQTRGAGVVAMLSPP